MARIRTIKPEFWTSEQVVECSPIARLLFVGMWNFCDDSGVHPASTKRLKMEVFPADAIEDSIVRALVDELIAAGLIVEYESEGQSYWLVTGWKHQKIDRPTSRYPAPKFVEHSSSHRRDVGDRSPPEGKGREGKGKERNIPPSEVCSEPPFGDSEPASAEPDSETIMVFPCVGRGPTEWPLKAAKAREYELSFPGVDVLGECRKARQWCIDNRAKRKTANGMPAFLSRWLGKCQNAGVFHGNDRGNHRAASDPTRVRSNDSDGIYTADLV